MTFRKPCEALMMRRTFKSGEANINCGWKTCNSKDDNNYGL